MSDFRCRPMDYSLPLLTWGSTKSAERSDSASRAVLSPLGPFDGPKWKEIGATRPEARLP